mmetsp:Transcript_15373/g.27446  ORF Transcript_15373/g.27446 Transcript_15373/m.27446 type:complete len:1298 (+) Transcript_15373:21-3914(+)
MEAIDVDDCLGLGPEWRCDATNALRDASRTSATPVNTCVAEPPGVQRPKMLRHRLRSFVWDSRKKAITSSSKASQRSKELQQDESKELALQPRVRRGKKIEEIYQKKTPVQHVLLRPDTYVGSTEKQEEVLWVWDHESAQMQYRAVSYVPALYKIFDEILVNAVDNLQRDKKMSCIKVDIDFQKRRIKVWNDGKGLPITVHKTHKVYVPELVFGHLLTSENYDDSERKIVGGRNGYGAKLTNIFSSRFIVETAGKGKRYRQQWTSNMSRKTTPNIEDYSGEDYTSVEFWPDLERFGMNEFEPDILSLMRRRVYDIAGTTWERCNVALDGQQLPVQDFKGYCATFHKGSSHAYARVNKRWEVLVAMSDGNGFHQNSFVNGISTPKGGTHVQHVTDQLLDAIMAKADREAVKNSQIKKVHIRNHLWVFINCLIENPAFNSQTKEQMTLKPSGFGSSCTFPSTFIADVVARTGILKAVLTEASARLVALMDKERKKGGCGKRIFGIPKLEDAHEAGGRNAEQCTLILCEGDSAKALAVAGLSVIGRAKFGIFPLRGKLLNVSDVSHKQVMENKEVMNVAKALGLSFDKRSEQRRLRYGSVTIMADQDFDGSHIKGLLINLFYRFWPDLLKTGGFLKEFITPIVKVTKGPQTVQFFTQAEYETWKKQTGGGSGWHVKYYKGLGTSTSKEAKTYFSAIHQHCLDFAWQSDQDAELIDMAFSKSRADDRKSWMNGYKEGTHIDHSQLRVPYQDFINLELVQFSRYDLMRNVPSIMDGLKPTQRKILFSCFKRNLRKDVKVAQLIGYVAEHTAYHHGEISLGGAIISMAQDFVGSNNLNLLVPSGQFGTRLQGGKDAASTRYIYTRLSPVSRLIFSPLDDAVLTFLEEEGQRIEPKWYAPIIPMVLVNGADGIGTGWSTSVPNYNPLHIIDNLRLFLRGEMMHPMQPWYRGFTGTIQSTGDGQYLSCGVWNELEGKGLAITELPLKRWTQDYKEFLQSMLARSDRRAKTQIQDILEFHTLSNVNFEVRMSNEDLNAVKEHGVETIFKLHGRISESNMVLFDKCGKIKKYGSPLEIMAEFAEERLELYMSRKNALLAKLALEKEFLHCRARFIALILAGELVVQGRSVSDIVTDLERLEFKQFGDTDPPKTGYEYLLGMPIASLTRESKLDIERTLKAKKDELEQLRRTSARQLWEADLNRLEGMIQELFKSDTEDDGDKFERGTRTKRSVPGDKQRRCSRRSHRSSSPALRSTAAEENSVSEGSSDEEDTKSMASCWMTDPLSNMAAWIAAPSATGSSAKRRRM